MATKNQTVELRLAYAWDCDECGEENFERAVVYEVSPAEKAELAERGLPSDTGNWLTPPEHVTCRGCGAAFQAKHFRAGDDSIAEQEEA